LLAVIDDAHNDHYAGSGIIIEGLDLLEQEVNIQMSQLNIHL
jgi:hypothetical protein